MIKVDQANIQSACSVLDKVLVEKGSNVHYGMVLIEAKASGLQFTATNGAIESSVLVETDCSICLGSLLCVPGKFFSRLIRSLDGKLSIDFNDLSIDIGQEDGSLFSVQGVEGDLFPRISSAPSGEFSEIDSELLLDALHGVVWTADNKGVRLKITEDTLEASAIAGSSRAAIFKAHIQSDVSTEAILPLETTKALIEGLKQADCETVRISTSGSSLGVQAGNVSFSSRLLSQMPDVGRLFGAMSQWKIQAECDRKELIAAIAPVAVYAQNQEKDEDKPVIRLNFKDGELSLKDGRSANLAEKIIPVDFEGEFDIAFDHSLLTSLLKTMKNDDRVVFHLKERSPAFITYPGGGHVAQIALLAPISII
jgi:DNA polymerase III sliding clamp (beta) subunit (PCNA family)